MKRIGFALILALLVLLAGCAKNPADDVPAAETSEPTTSVADNSGLGDELEALDSALYVIADTSSKVTWVGSKVTGSHDGGFNTFEGTINLVDGKPESSSVSIVIDTTSMFSDNDNLTEHLKSADFFEVETYPTATFASNSITPVEDGTPDVYDVVGNLTLHGVTKQISFPATITVAGNDVKASAEFSVMRFDYGIEYKGAADDLIRDEVVIKLDIAGEPLDELMPETPAEETAS